MSERRGSVVKKSLRKESKDKQLRSSTVSFDDESHLAVKQQGSSSGFKIKVPNTYRMEPKQKFLPHLVQKRADELMRQAFGEEMAYDHDMCRSVADKVTADILAFVKEQVFDRYRYVVRVVVGDKRGQAVMVASRTLWDDDKDNFLTVRHETRQLFAVAMIFAVYLE